MQLKVSKALDNLPRLDYRNLLELQGNLKSLSDADAERLRVNLFGNGKDIAPNGFIVPFFVWFEPKTNKPYIVDGHQRLRVLKLADAQPYELPYIEIQAATKKEAKQKVLLISSQYGKVSREGFEEFSLDLNLDISWLDSTTTFASFAMPELAANEFSAEQDNALYGGGQKLGGESGEAEEDYSILDAAGIDDKLNQLESGVRKAIQIEFEPEDYDEAFAIVKFWREQKMYIGAFLVEKLKHEKSKL